MVIFRIFAIVLIFIWRFIEFGANVVIADLDTKGGQELADSFNG